MPFTNEQRRAYVASRGAYFTGKPCKRGHVALRRPRGQCIECEREYAISDAARAKKVRSVMAWKGRNPSRIAASDGARRAAHVRGTPQWLSSDDRDLIHSIYQLSRIYTIALGEKFHVDHEIPLVSDLVCGLHVPWNLRVIPAEENLRKSNRLLLS